MTIRSSLRDARTAVLVTFLLVVFFGRFPIIDDAYIVLRYAANLASHLGFVFNPGERVEGTTSALWVIYLALWARLGVNLETVAVISALACVLVAAVRTLDACRVLQLDDWTSGVAVIGLLVAPGFVPALANGLEGALYAAVVAESIYRLARGQATMLGLLGLVLFAIRPEGLCLGAVFLLASWRYAEPSGGTRSAWAAAAAMLIGAAAITSARVWYFGSPLPNSVIAKSYPLAVYFSTAILLSGMYYVARFALAYAWITVPAAAALWQLRRGDIPAARQRGVVAACLMALGVAGLAAVRNGGDWMPGFRLIVQYSPALAVAATIGVEAVRAQAPLLPRWGVAVLLIPLATMSLVQRTENVPLRQLTRQLFAESRIRPAEEDATGRVYGRVASSLGGLLSNGDVVSAEAVGLISYRLPAIRIHDPAGLVDPFIARYGRPAPPFGHLLPTHTVYDTRPAVMVWHYPRHLETLDLDVLNRNYATVCVDSCDALRRGPTWDAIIVMIRRDRLASLGPAIRDAVGIEFSAGGLRQLSVGPVTGEMSDPGG